VGGLIVALSFVVIWWVPTGERVRGFFSSDGAYEWFQLGYILVALMVFFTACNVFEIPHGALGLEMSADPHERTRLFSGKSFLGNLFAMGTPWFIALAGMKFFKGTGGTLIDGMRYVSFLIAAVLIPMTFWWFFSLREPGFALAKKQKKSTFWHDMRETIHNRPFVILTLAIFTLAMGFNFVANLANYITIFYLYGGNVDPASVVLGINGTVWAVTALVAVFPLNWISRRVGKRNALLVAILLMCAAQVSKIFCYHPGELFTINVPEALFGETTFTFQGPYLILIPTMLLSAGMLMFFTLGPSMVGDICDEDELQTGTRSEGMFFSVFWWFIKTGGAFASLVGGLLLLFTTFDEDQNVLVDGLQSTLAVIEADAGKWQENSVNAAERVAALNQQLDRLTSDAAELRQHFAERLEKHPSQIAHLQRLAEQIDSFRSQVTELRAGSADLAVAPAEVISQVETLRQETLQLKQQTPIALFRLRLVEIGVPLVLSIVTIVLTLRYPLTEARSYEIKAELEKRRGTLVS
jgi:GPH family glycoside/pentoside/hexuronide:cation symporter